MAPTPQAGGLPEAAVLEEIPGPLGVFLWRSLRSVQAWAETPPARRGEIFPEGAYESRMADLVGLGAPAGIEVACASLARLLAHPTATRSDAVTSHCLCVASWARDEQKHATALAFFQAAATCCPFNPTLALMSGREARDLALYAVAESWLTRAIAVARQIDDWDTYGRAHIAVGTMLRSRGALPAARHHFLKAERRGRRHGLREVRGMALHDLFAVVSATGPMDEALEFARQAVEVYGPGSPRMVNLAFDVAFFWMQQGYFSTALPIYHLLLPRIEPRFHAHVQGAIARAAGACDRAVEHLHAVRVLDTLPVGPGTSEAWLDAAHGAVSLSRWADADLHAGRALETARARAERKIEFLAESLLEGIAERNRPASAPSVQETQPAVQELALELVGTLERVPALSPA